jgi:DNA-binding XRE family transcriptional regulator
MSRPMSAMEDWLVDLSDDPLTLKEVAGVVRPKTMGKRLKVTRRVYNVKQSDLEPIVGVSDATISMWEADVGEGPRVSQLLALAELYGQMESAETWQPDWVLWVMGFADTPPLLRGFHASLPPEGY